MATRDCYLATSVNQPGDAVVHQVRSRGRKAPGKRQVESSAAPKTHGASTGLTGLISGFGTKRPWRFRPMSALRLGCVKTCASRERAELFSPFSSFDCDCQCCSFPIQRNRDKRSTRKFAIGARSGLTIDWAAGIEEIRQRTDRQHIGGGRTIALNADGRGAGP